MVTKKKNKAKVSHSFRLDPELNDAFEAICDERGQSYDSAAVEAIKRWVADNDPARERAGNAAQG